jgi:hypothetical protein
MPNDVIDRVRNLAWKANPNLGLLFTDRHGHPLKDNAVDYNDSDNDSYCPEDNSKSESDNDSGSNSDADNDYPDDVDAIPIAGVNNDANDENENSADKCF